MTTKKYSGEEVKHTNGGGKVIFITVAIIEKVFRRPLDVYTAEVSCLILYQKMHKIQE